MIRGTALVLTLFVTTIVTGFGLIDVDEAPTAPLQIPAPAVVPVFPEVEALAPAHVRALSTARARRLARDAERVARAAACRGKVPRTVPLGGAVSIGASVVAIARRGGKLRLLPGVVVDSVGGKPFGAAGTKVLRLTSEVRAAELGPVLDAKGRIVGVVFAVDPRTTLGVALPVPALRSLVADRKLEALPACG